MTSLRNAAIRDERDGVLAEAQCSHGDRRKMEVRQADAVRGVITMRGHKIGLRHIAETHGLSLSRVKEILLESMAENKMELR